MIVFLHLYFFAASHVIYYFPTMEAVDLDLLYVPDPINTNTPFLNIVISWF